MSPQDMVNVAVDEVELKCKFLTQRNIALACELVKTREELKVFTDSAVARAMKKSLAEEKKKKET